jgi:uncharacterized protein YndB with AHSA1/START domain
MGFPDRIERSISVAHPPAKVWEAITTAEGLGTWFGQKATVDLRVGGLAQLTFGEGGAEGGHIADLRIERLEPPHVFGYTWGINGLPADDARRTYVEFTLEPEADGTRLTVVESGFAQLPDDVHSGAYGGNVNGWQSELDELIEYLDAHA